jgi:Calpain family cysteine protease
LVRIKNPWANAQEWSGQFNDNDASSWTRDIKQQFNEKNMLDGYSDNERYIHRWNVEDGIFVMKIEDFIEMFNALIVVRDYPD